MFAFLKTCGYFCFISLALSMPAIVPFHVLMLLPWPCHLGTVSRFLCIFLFPMMSISRFLCPWAVGWTGYSSLFIELVVFHFLAKAQCKILLTEIVVKTKLKPMRGLVSLWYLSTIVTSRVWLFCSWWCRVCINVFRERNRGTHLALCKE